MGDDLRRRVRAAKPDLLAALRRERIERLLDLVPVNPWTGLPNLPPDEPATDRQAERLRELAADPAFEEHRERVREIVETALDRGLSQIGAWGLIGDLGRRIARRRRNDERPSAESADCPACGRPVGPVPALCGSCKRGSNA